MKVIERRLKACPSNADLRERIINPINLQTFVQNSFESSEVRILANDIRSQVATIKGGIRSASFVRSTRSGM